MRPSAMAASWVVAAAAACFASMSAGAAEPQGPDFYVSPRGDDDNLGSRDKPFQTIARAAAVAGPGAVIRIQAGAYAERVAPVNSGAAEAPITLRKEGPGEVIWTAPPGDFDHKKGMGAALDLDGKSHFVVDGITFKDCTCWITMRDAHHHTVQNCTFDGEQIYNSFFISNGSYIRILNCDFKRARPYVTDAQGVSTSATAADFIEMFRNSHHNLVEGCKFGEIGHCAVLISCFQPGFRPTHNIIRNCTFTSPMWKCVGLEGAENTLIENCTMSGKAAVFFQFEAGRVIVRRNLFCGFRSSLRDKGDPYRGVFRVATTKDSDCDCNFAHNRIYNNLFYDNDRTITSYEAEFPIKDNEFKNNIFYNNRMTLWLCQPTAGTTGFVNNVLFGAKAGEKLLGYERKQYTLAEAAEKMPQAYRGNLEDDPKFADAAKMDFHLKEGSPCIAAGANLTAASADGSGQVVPVEDPLYFCDGFGLIDGDQIVVGANKPVRVTKVDCEKKTLEVDRPIAWQKGDAVNQPFSGKAPDVGPFVVSSEF